MWPGQNHKPPIGKPTHFHLKIVTLQEPPFVIYKNPTNGNCTSNSVLVRISPDKHRLKLAMCINQVAKKLGPGIADMGLSINTRT